MPVLAADEFMTIAINQSVPSSKVLPGKDGNIPSNCFSAVLIKKVKYLFQWKKGDKI
jgi:hypothetical protein